VLGSAPAVCALQRVATESGLNGIRASLSNYFGINRKRKEGNNLAEVCFGAFRQHFWVERRQR